MDLNLMALNETIKKESVFVERMLAEVREGGGRTARDARGHHDGPPDGWPRAARRRAWSREDVNDLVVAKAISLGFQRVQFTPDLMPTDLTWTMIFNPKSGEFVPKQGPIFTNIVLADEINRAPPMVQSALLEAMAEKQVTIGDVTYPLERPFLVLATQNPLEQEGTYPLPKRRLDRFMFKIVVTYPKRAEEMEILKPHGDRSDAHHRDHHLEGRPGARPRDHRQDLRRR